MPRLGLRRHERPFLRGHRDVNVLPLMRGGDEARLEGARGDGLLQEGVKVSARTLFRSSPATIDRSTSPRSCLTR